MIGVDRSYYLEIAELGCCVSRVKGQHLLLLDCKIHLHLCWGDSEWHIRIDFILLDSIKQKTIHSEFCAIIAFAAEIAIVVVTTFPLRSATKNVCIIGSKLPKSRYLPCGGTENSVFGIHISFLHV